MPMPIEFVVIEIQRYHSWKYLRKFQNLEMFLANYSKKMMFREKKWGGEGGRGNVTYSTAIILV
jgi:starvation-inducible outer membrane lipoprotein